MRFGICTSIDNARLVADAGYDYLEVALRPLAAMDDDTFARELDAIGGLPLPVEACNVLFPGEMRLTGPDVDLARVEEYLRSALARAAAVGAKVVVFGSGKARQTPAGFTSERGVEQVVEMLRIAGPIAEANGVTIVIEPLRSQEDNLITNAAHGLDVALAVGHPAVRLLVDYYHMRSEDESPQIIRTAGNEMLRHCHIARLDGRRWPRPEDDEPYDAFFAALRDIGYEGRVSIEGSSDDPAADAHRAMEVFARYR